MPFTTFLSSYVLRQTGYEKSVGRKGQDVEFDWMLRVICGKSVRHKAKIRKTIGSKGQDVKLDLGVKCKIWKPTRC